MIKNENFIWNTIGTSLNSFLSLFLLIIVTRINGIELSGIFSFVFTLTLIIQTFSNYGGRIYQISDSKNEFSFSEYLGSRLITSLLSFIILLILCLIFKLDFLGTFLAVNLMIFRIIETFSDVFYASFQKNEHLDYVGKSLTLKSALVLTLFLILNIAFKNLILASLGIVIASLIIFILYDFRIIKKNEIVRLNFNADLYKKSKYVFLFNFITLLILNIPRFIANYTISETEIGYLGILMMIPTVMALICQFIIQPQLVDLTKTYEDKDIKLFNNILKKSIIVLTGFSFICVFLAVTLGPFVLKVLYGIPFEHYRFSFVILIFAGTFNGITTILSNVLTIFRKTKQQFIAYTIMLVISFFMTFIMSHLYYLNGIFYGLVFTMIMQCCIFYCIYIQQKHECFK